MTLRLITMLCLIAAVSRACDCIEAPAREAARYSEIVFRGTVVRFRYPKNGDTVAVFKVARVWKGPVTAEFEMLAAQGDGCSEFPPGLLRLGSEVLVYAQRLEGPDYFPMRCNTTLVQNAKDILKLGPGRKSISNVTRYRR